MKMLQAELIAYERKFRELGEQSRAIGEQVASIVEAELIQDAI